jgi:vacuolar-type H+-ATPase subunit F/Vma7
MKLVVIGRADELTGFALAGVETVTCDASVDAARVVESVAAPAAGAGLVLVSPWIAQHAGRVIEAVQQRKGPPVITVIPGLGERP